MGVFCHILHKDYRNILIQVCCLEGVTQSPILAHFDGTLSWSAPIHAYDQQVDFQEEFKRRVDKNSRTFLTIAECNVWFYQCLDWMSAGIQAVIMVVLMINWFLGIGINSGLIALVLSNMAGIGGALGEISYSMADLEQGMQSVECLLHHSFLPPEEEEELPESKAEPVPKEWSVHGTIEFRNYSTRYRPELPLVLKNVLFKINHGEKGLALLVTQGVESPPHCSLCSRSSIQWKALSSSTG